MTNKLTELFTNSLIFDTETTSKDFKVAEVIQFASAEYNNSTDQFEIVFNEYYKPHEPIDAEVSAINFISNRMVANCEKFDCALLPVQLALDKCGYVVAHNVFYDQKVLERYGLSLPKTICTMRMAKKLYNDSDKIKLFNLSYLRFALDLPIPDDITAHNAVSDVIVTGILYQTLIADAIAAGVLDVDSDLSFGEQITAWLDEPIIMRLMPFGKHKGKELNEVPLEYWRWAFENLDSLNEERPEFDKDFAASATQVVETLLGVD